MITARLSKLDDYVRHLRELRHAPLDEYLDDENLQAIVERRLQLAIQACMDIAGYLIAQMGIPTPDAPDNVFVALGRAGVISEELAQRMAGMVRFRNILVHDYLDIDSMLVHAHLASELADFDRFAAEITARILNASD